MARRHFTSILAYCVMAVAEESLLDILQAHGQQFLDSFGLPENTKKRKRSSGSLRTGKIAKCEIATRSSSVDFSDSVEGWSGFESDTHIGDYGWEPPSPSGEVTPLEGVLASFNGNWEISTSH
jgi:hypothetical protein